MPVYTNLTRIEECLNGAQIESATILETDTGNAIEITLEDGALVYVSSNEAYIVTPKEN